MAHSKQALKRIRQTETRRVRRHSALSRLRTFLRQQDEAVSANDKERAKEAFQKVMSHLHKAARTGLIHKGRASRKLHRLSVRIKAMS